MLTLHTNDKMKDMMRPGCSVKIDAMAENYDQFVVVGIKNGEAEMSANADAILLGKSAGLIFSAFKTTMAKLTDEEQAFVMHELQEVMQ